MKETGFMTDVKVRDLRDLAMVIRILETFKMVLLVVKAFIIGNTEKFMTVSGLTGKSMVMACGKIS